MESLFSFLLCMLFFGTMSIESTPIDIHKFVESKSFNITTVNKHIKSLEECDELIRTVQFANRPHKQQKYINDNLLLCNRTITKEDIAHCVRIFDEEYKASGDRSYDVDTRTARTVDWSWVSQFFVCVK